MYHACHDICTFSPLDTAAPMRFANNAQHRTSNVLRRPQRNTWISQCAAPATKNANHLKKSILKVLRLSHKTTFDAFSNSSKCHKGASQNDVTRLSRLPETTTFAAPTKVPHCEWRRTVAASCGRQSNPERTHTNTPRPPTPNPQ